MYMNHIEIEFLIVCKRFLFRLNTGLSFFESETVTPSILQVETENHLNSSHPEYYTTNFKL